MNQIPVKLYRLLKRMFSMMVSFPKHQNTIGVSLPIVFYFTTNIIQINLRSMMTSAFTNIRIYMCHSVWFSMFHYWIIRHSVACYTGVVNNPRRKNKNVFMPFQWSVFGVQKPG